MSTQTIPSQQQEKETYKRNYPLYTSVRIRNSNLEKIKARATRYNQSVDDLISDMIMKLEYYERQGYETLEAERSF
jgi:hypothetical protein